MKLSSKEVPQAVSDSLSYRALKRTFDVCFSAVVLTVLFVPSAALCAAISLESPGGPFFRQNRVGKDGRTIRIWKFRSMYADAHECPERYLDDAQMVQWGREQKVDADPRVTKIGRIIRATSLDEVPQFLNVLVGEMSVVGPRPVTEEETYEFGPDRDEALSVRPGITGWWQVNDRNDATWDNGKRQELELWYVRNRSARLDLEIALRTAGVMFGRDKTGR